MDHTTELLQLEALADSLITQATILKQRCHNLRTKGRGANSGPRKGKKEGISERAAAIVAMRNKNLKIAE